MSLLNSKRSKQCAKLSSTSPPKVLPKFYQVYSLRMTVNSTICNSIVWDRKKSAPSSTSYYSLWVLLLFFLSYGHLRCCSCVQESKKEYTLGHFSLKSKLACIHQPSLHPTLNCRKSPRCLLANHRRKRWRKSVSDWSLSAVDAPNSKSAWWSVWNWDV